MFAMRRKEMEALRLGRCKVVLPSVVDRDIKMRPVVQPRPRYRAVIQRKAERTHKVQRHAKPDAEPSNGASVVRNLRPQKNYGEIHHRVNYIVFQAADEIIRRLTDSHFSEYYSTLN